MQDWNCTTEEFFSFEGLPADDSWLEDSPPSFFQE
jgi:hypothetical protein